MKTNAVVLIVSAGVGAALVGVGACSSMMGNKAKKVVIEDGRIFIPGTSVSQADQDSVMAILGQYKRSLYKIQTYKDGNPSGRPHGALADKIIGEATVAQVAGRAGQPQPCSLALRAGPVEDALHAPVDHHMPPNDVVHRVRTY